MISDDDRVLKMMSRDILTSDRKRPADFSNEDEPDLKKRYMNGNIGVVSNMARISRESLFR